MKAGWEVKPLNSVALVCYGTRVVRKQDQGSLYPVYGGGGPTFQVDQFNREDCMIISRFGMSAECVRRVSGRFFLNDSGLSVTSKNTNLLSQPFLDALLLNKSSDIFALGRGTAQKNLDVEAFKLMPIPLPPLDEQKRIVVILDEAFGGLDCARANAEANLADARDLPESHFEQVFANPASEWQLASLGSLCEQITVGHVGPMASRYSDTGIPFLRSQNIRPFRVDLSDVKYIDAKFMSELRKSELRPGDVAIVRTGYPGTCAVIPETLEIANCADLVIARTGPNLDPHFMAMLLNSRFGKEHVAHVSVGAAQKHFNVGAARAAKFYIPPVSIQRELVKKSDQMRALCSQLESEISAKEGQLNMLRQSFLQKAFSGELT